MKIEKRKILRVLSLALYFIAAFLLFLVVRFPFDRVTSRIESEVRTRTQLELSVARIAPGFLNRFTLIDVVLADKDGRVLFESSAIKAHLSLLGFLRGVAALDLAGPVYGGNVVVKAEQGARRASWSVDASNLDLASYPLFKQLGYKIAGTMGGNFEMAGASGKGRIWFKNLASREIKVVGFSVPDLDFEQGWVEAEIKGDRLTIRKFELDGKELKLRVSGDLVLSARGAMNLAIKLKPSQRLEHEQAALLSLLKNRDAEGYYQFTLGGTVNAPFPRL